MLTLYENATSGNCYKIRLLLAHLRREYQRISIDLVSFDERPPALVEATPEGRLPALVLDDGRTLFESNAILHHLARGSAYLPEDAVEATETLAWMFFEQNQHEPHIATRRYWVALAESSAPRAQQLDYWHARGEQTLGVMEAHLARRDWFAAGRYTIADIALYGYTHVADEGGFDLAPYEHVNAWLARVREQPGHVTMDT